MFAAEYMRSYAACILFALFFLGGWEAPFQDTLANLPWVGGIAEFGLSLIPGVGWVLLKAWALFAVFVWIRASLHRVRTDQILEFGWRYLLPLSLVHLVMTIAIRILLWDGGPWNLLIPIAITAVSGGIFVILAIDEDKDALEIQRRPYSTQAVVKASPGSHRD